MLREGNTDAMVNNNNVNTYDVNRFISVEKAKIVALLIVVASICYHGLIHLNYGNSSCQWLLSDGRFQGYDEWQPFGCMMHKYSKSDSRNCMQYVSYWGGRNHFAFIGDSRIRQLFYEFVGMLSKDVVKSEKVHSNLNYVDDKTNLVVDFLWHPMVNDSMRDVFAGWAESKSRPRVIVTGSATWSIKLNNASEDAIDIFKENLTNIIPFFSSLQNTTKIIWMLQDPVIESRLAANRSMINNRQIDLYNRAAFEALLFSKALIWSSSRLIAQGFNDQSAGEDAGNADGLHIVKKAIEWDVQILLNMLCNNYMNFNDGSCCSSPETFTTTQIVLATVFLISLIMAVVLSVWIQYIQPFLKSRRQLRTGQGVEPEATSDETTKQRNLYELTSSVAKLGLIMFYFFLCDRTTFFMKENKYYTHVNFFLPFCYLMILGFFFTESTKQTAVLHRNQTDEWKGWMQLVILIYHLTGASKVISIYMQIRVMVSAYLFLSAFGHFYYFFSKACFSFHRFCTVIVRFNFLVVLLCLAMNRPYQFYYFIPLVTFWFSVIYLVMAVWPRITFTSLDCNMYGYLFMILKLAALAAAVTLMYSSEVFFEKIFLSRPLKSLFVSSDDSLFDWRFRWSLDRYSSLYGMVFAFGLLVAKKLKLLDDSHSNDLFSRNFTWLAGFLSFCGVAGYATFTGLCKSKEQCNEVHSYISFVPIVSYIFLRNLPGWLRTKYSAFFAWFGRISLELFIAQYHIWLAADTHGILVLIPSFPVMNLIVTSFIFVCIAHEIHRLTTVLLPYLVPAETRYLLRNTVLLALVMLPLIISRGVISF